MKRFLSAVLLLSLLLTIFSGSVNAAGQEIDSIEVKGLDEPKWGMTPDYQLDLSANAHCKIDTSLNVDGYYNGVRWERWGVGPLTPTDTFGNATYVLYFCLRADAGYSFSENPVFNSLYGEPGGSFIAQEGPEKGCLVVGYSFTVSTETATLTIQVNTGGGKGTATGAGEYAIGSAVTVRAYPEMGYGFYGWSGEGDRFITSQLDYSFTITEDTVLFADFTTAPFKDICGRDYFYDPVVWAVDEGITNGTGNDAFSPLETCTRGQVVTFLHRSAGSPWPHSPISPFTDVTGGEYYYDAVMWAVPHYLRGKRRNPQHSHRGILHSSGRGRRIRNSLHVL